MNNPSGIRLFEDSRIGYALARVDRMRFLRLAIFEVGRIFCLILNEALDGRWFVAVRSLLQQVFT